jgi:hypothetical protein
LGTVFFSASKHLHQNRQTVMKQHFFLLGTRYQLHCVLFALQAAGDAIEFKLENRDMLHKYNMTELWPFSMAHAVYLRNHLSCKDIKKSPLKLFAKAVLPSELYLQRQHVWDCPTYVLDPKFQDGKKRPKWDPGVER